VALTRFGALTAFLRLWRNPDLETLLRLAIPGQRKSKHPMADGRELVAFGSRFLRPLSRIGLVLVPLVLAGCAGSFEKPDEPVVETRVRQPAQQQNGGAQVYPLRNPAVVQLLDDAGAAEQSGDYGQAAALLERALRIQPRNPEVLQQMAEVQLHIRDYRQALNFAERSYELGPRVGEICSRNWRTISVAREYLGDRGGAAAAEQRAGSCMSAKPPSL